MHTAAPPSGEYNSHCAHPSASAPLCDSVNGLPFYFLISHLRVSTTYVQVLEIRSLLFSKSFSLLQLRATSTGCPVGGLSADVSSHYLFNAPLCACTSACVCECVHCCGVRVRRVSLPPARHGGPFFLSDVRSLLCG